MTHRWLVLAWVLVLPAAHALAGRADDCTHACEIEVKTCGAAARADRKGCFRECEAGEAKDAGAKGCRIECRTHYKAARTACLDSRRTCTRKCGAPAPASPCAEACAADRADCVRALRRAGETGPCRKACEADAKKARAACGGDDVCLAASQSSLAACLRGCTQDAKQAQETCHGRFESCVGACARSTPHAPSPTPASSPTPSASGGRTPG